MPSIFARKASSFAASRHACSTKRVALIRGRPHAVMARIMCDMRAACAVVAASSSDFAVKNASRCVRAEWKPCITRSFDSSQ